MINEETKKEDILKHIEKTIDKKLRGDRKSIRKHPILFGILGTFGMVSVVIGLEGIITQIPYLHNNPYILVIFGVIILFFTGAIYRLLEG